MLPPQIEREYIAWLKELQGKIWKPGVQLFRHQELSCLKEARNLTLEEWQKLAEMFACCHFPLEIQSDESGFGFGFNVYGRLGGEEEGRFLASFVSGQVPREALGIQEDDFIQKFRDALFNFMEPFFRDERNIRQLIALGKDLPQHRGAYKY